jgi:hypothetical protein
MRSPSGSPSDRSRDVKDTTSERTCEESAGVSGGGATCHETQVAGGLESLDQRD